MRQERVTRTAERTYSAERLASESSRVASTHATVETAATDELLAEIDEVLSDTLTEAGESAQEFVARYHQKGGEQVIFDHLLNGWNTVLDWLADRIMPKEFGRTNHPPKHHDPTLF